LLHLLRSSCPSYLLLFSSIPLLDATLYYPYYSTTHVRSCILLFLIFHLFLLRFLLLIPHVPILIHRSSHLVTFIRYVSVSVSPIYFSTSSCCYYVHTANTSQSLYCALRTLRTRQDKTRHRFLADLTSLSGKQCSASSM
jgi:hypothetical protein